MPDHQIHSTIGQRLRLRNKTLNRRKTNTIRIKAPREKGTRNETKRFEDKKEGVGYGHEDGSSATICAPQ